MSLTYFLYRLAGVIVPKVPPSLGYFACRLLGGILYQLNKQGRLNIQCNLRHVLGPSCAEPELKRRVRLGFNYILYNYFDLFRLSSMTDDEVRQVVTVDGWEHVEQALAEGRGVVMTSAHLGNIEVVLYAMLLRGLTITIPVERIEPPELFDYVSSVRSSKGLTVIPIDGPLLHLIRTLKKGGVAGLAADRDITGTGQTQEFFGSPARLPDGHVRLALRTGAPLVLGFSRRKPDYTYEAYFLPPFHPPPDGSEEERVAAAMRIILSEMEKAIAQSPEQWALTVPIWEDC